MQAWLNAARAGGFANRVWVSNNNYAGIHDFLSNGNQVLASIVDPRPAGFAGTWVPNWGNEMHQYSDRNNSGGVGTVPENGGTPNKGLPANGPFHYIDRCRATFDWHEANNIPVMIGEFGIPNATHLTPGMILNGQLCAHALLEECSSRKLANGQPLVQCVTPWGAGPGREGDYIDNLSPTVRPNSTTRQDVYQWNPPPGNSVKAEGWAVLDRFYTPTEGGVPNWANPASSVELDFARNRRKGAATFASVIACARASAVTDTNRQGQTISFAANEPRITDQGLRVLDADTVTLTGALLAALNGNAFALMVETFGIPDATGDVPLVDADGVVLLRRNNNGSPQSLIGGGQILGSGAWVGWAQNHHRWAVSVNRGTGRVAVCSTSTATFEGGATAPAFTSVRLRSRLFKRLLVIPSFLNGTELRKLTGSTEQ